MPSKHMTLDDLNLQLDYYREMFSKLSDDELFMVWFLRAYVTEDEKLAKNSITCGPKEKGVDAVLFDEKLKIVFVAQGKLRENLEGKNEKRSDVLEFARVGCDLWGDKDAFARLTKKMDQGLKGRMIDARERLMTRKYRLMMYYITLGRCSRDLSKEAEAVVRKADGKTEIEILGGRRVMFVLSEWLEGIGPPVPSLDLVLEQGPKTVNSPPLRRLDSGNGMESWVFSMTAKSIADLYGQVGERLFARNVRGFLGNTKINVNIDETLESEPNRFWYYNNGLTMICDRATPGNSGGRSILTVTNPQVVNGHQTTREMYEHAEIAPDASVLVRVISVQRDVDESPVEFSSFVNQIVTATNSQNKIRASDLKANDVRQIEIERQLRKLGYFYSRKRRTQSEVAVCAGRGVSIVRKEELARAVAACERDPSVIGTKGIEGLFEQEYDNVFPNSDPWFYLRRYWFMRHVDYAARGVSDRKHAKWVVLRFVWDHAKPIVQSGNMARAFSESYDGYATSANHLQKAVNAVFKSCLRFYRKRRGKGESAINIAAFFKRTKQHEAFERFWFSGSNIHRAEFGKSLKKWEEALEAEATE